MVLSYKEFPTPRKWSRLIENSVLAWISHRVNGTDVEQSANAALQARAHYVAGALDVDRIRTAAFLLTDRDVPGKVIYRCRTSEASEQRG